MYIYICKYNIYVYIYELLITLKNELILLFINITRKKITSLSQQD